MNNKAHERSVILINNFRDLLIRFQLSKNNVCISGRCALALHVLEMQTIPQDLDIIIYNITKEQFSIIDTYLLLNPQATQRSLRLSEYECDPLNIDIPEVLSFYSLIIQGIKIDIFLSTEQMPTNLLNYNVNVADKIFVFPVHSINATIEAKNNYGLEKSMQIKGYRRLKDFQELKNSNFNYTL